MEKYVVVENLQQNAYDGKQKQQWKVATVVVRLWGEKGRNVKSWHKIAKFERAFIK